MTASLQRFWFGAAGWLLAAAAVIAPLALVAVGQAPVEKLQGPPQKIFYLHVPLAWSSFLMFGGTTVAAVAYLFTRKRFWDWAGHGLAASGYLLLTGVLLTGPIWAKPIWGVYWVWDPRLTTTFLLWVIYGAYFLVRFARGNDGWTARACAVLAIFAFVDIPIIHLSVLWWRTLHPLPVVMRQGDVGGGLTPEMRAPLLAMFAFLLLLGLGLAGLRGHLRRQEDILEDTR